MFCTSKAFLLTSHNMKRFVIILLIFIAAFSKGQNKMEFGKATKAVIPFQLINSLIFIPVQLNGVNLTFLLDSGVANTIIFSTQDKDLSLNDVSKMKFTGLGGLRNRRCSFPEKYS